MSVRHGPLSSRGPAPRPQGDARTPVGIRPGDVDARVFDSQCVVRRLLEHLTEGRGDRRLLADQVSLALTLNAAAQEAVLYPEMAAVVDDRVTTRARDSNLTIQNLLRVIDSHEPSSDEFETALEQLAHEVRVHSADELVWLGLLRSQLGANRMAQLGRDYAAVTAVAPVEARSRATDASGLLTPQMQLVVDALAGLGPAPLQYLSPERARHEPMTADAVRVLLESRGEALAAEPVGGVRDIRLADQGGGSASGDGGLVRLYHPTDTDGEQLPVMVYIHGGGWVLGDLDAYDATARALANSCRSIVASVDYRKAPEHPFPAAHDDVLRATQWVMANAARFGGDPLRIVIAGESAGGNMAASTCLSLKSAGKRLPSCQVLIYPMTTAATDSPSMYDSADAFPFGRATMSWFTEQLFAGSELDMSNERFDLLGLPAEDLAGLPPTVIVTAERDPLRSQGEAFAELLAAAAVPVAARRFDGTTHEFFGLAPVLGQARLAQQFVAEQVRAVLAAS